MPQPCPSLRCTFPPSVRVLLSLKRLTRSQHTHTLSLSLSLFPFLSFPFSAAVERLTITACFTFAPLHDLGLTCIGSIRYLAFLFPELMHGPFVHRTPMFNVYARGTLIDDVNLWPKVRSFLAKCRYTSEELGCSHTNTSPYCCGICHSMDHPRGMCPFPLVKGWKGPRRIPLSRNGRSHRAMHASYT